jgi:LmbE family N-acetylglucosaminyl deacetylase
VRVLFIAAHPDDEVYGAGGTMARLANEGHEVFTLIVTDGSSTQYPGDAERAQIKLKECEEANRILGVRKVFYGGLPDMRLDTVPHVDVNACISKVIHEVKPEWVFTQHCGDVNKDHYAVFTSTLVACRPVPGQTVRRVYAYEVGSSTEWAAPRVENVFIPNTFVNISETIRQKISAVEAYATELRPYPHPRCPQAVEIYAQQRGVSVGVHYAEAFMLIRDMF